MTGDITCELKNKVVYELDIPSIVAGTKYRGEFEEKLKKIVKKIKEDHNAIIFIDEIHNIIGAGGAEGAIDASNILKPYLARGDIHCIGATTYDEYIKIIEKEKAIERRFQLIKLDEPNEIKCYEILKGIKKGYEDFHGVDISDNIINDKNNLLYFTKLNKLSLSFTRLFFSFFVLFFFFVIFYLHFFKIF